jgi:hypothetical protein
MRGVIAIVLSFPLALAAAAVMWGWWRSPVPTFLVFTPVLHGMLLGVGLAWLVGRLRITCPIRRMVIGIVAGIVTVVALACGQYLSDAADYQRDAQRAALRLVPATSAVFSSSSSNLLDDYDRNLLEPVTGAGGIIGHLSLQNHRAPWRGWLRGLESLLVIGIATTLCITAPRATPHQLPG